MGKLIRLTSDDESFRVYTPRVCVRLCCLVDFHGLAGLLAGVGGRTTPTSPVHTFCPCVKHHGNRYATLNQGLCGSPSFTTDRVLYECDRPIVQVSQPSKPVLHSVPSKLLSVIPYKGYWTTQDVTLLIAQASSLLLLLFITSVI